MALRVLAGRVDPVDAVRRARADPDASIRRLAPELQAHTGAPTFDAVLTERLAGTGNEFDHEEPAVPQA